MRRWGGAEVRFELRIKLNVTAATSGPHLQAKGAPKSRPDIAAVVPELTELDIVAVLVPAVFEDAD